MIFSFVGCFYIIGKERYTQNWISIITISFACFVIAPLFVIISYKSNSNLDVALNLFVIPLAGVGFGVFFGIPIYNIFCFFKKTEKDIKKMLVFLEKLEIDEQIDNEVDQTINDRKYRKVERMLNDGKRLWIDGKYEKSILKLFKCLEKSTIRIDGRYFPKYHQIVYDAYLAICKAKVEKLKDRYLWENYNCMESGLAGLFALSKIGYHEASYTLGKYYFNGQYVKQNKEAGSKILREAERQGSLKAKIILTDFEKEKEEEKNKDSESNQLDEVFNNLMECLT